MFVIQQQTAIRYELNFMLILTKYVKDQFDIQA